MTRLFGDKFGQTLVKFAIQTCSKQKLVNIAFSGFRVTLSLSPMLINKIGIVSFGHESDHPNNNDCVYKCWFCNLLSKV